jgi:uncharacterized membrane protein YhaH (DUF805 family)/uncharacterized membrane protein YphA (DoxX/SURF4 family)
MKYAVWVVRLVFAAWMIPAGLNHFVPLFPQPMGSRPLSHELIVALLDSHLFDLVKAVELLAGLSVLTGLFTPLALIMCMPVSFCVFFWDTPLEGWTSRAAIFGSSVLLCNVLLCLAHMKSYRAMFAVRSTPHTAAPSHAARAGRLVFGAWMLASGINHFFVALWPLATGHEPLAIQLMAALSHSGLLGVAMTLQLVTGALILTGFWVPVALCVVMPISTCALYWAVVLEHRPLGALLAIAAFALNGLLMLAYLDYYQGALERHALTIGEASTERTSFDFLYVKPNGRTSRGQFVGALVTLLVVAAFYTFVVKGLTAHWCLLMLVFPGIVLHARRLHDMGHNAWLVLVPAVLTVAAFAEWLHLVSVSPPLNTALPWAAAVVTAGFTLWGCVGSGQAEANRFGTPLAA